MVLIVCAPGSGCTTFKVTADERSTYFNATGGVRYAGISHLEMDKYYNGEVVYKKVGGAAHRNMVYLLTMTYISSR